VEEVEFAGLERLRERDLLWFGKEEIGAIRRYRPMTPSLPLSEVKDKLWDLRSPDDDKAVRVFDSFFSHGEGDLDDKLCDTFEEDCDQGQFNEDTCSFQSSDSWFVKDL